MSTTPATELGATANAMGINSSGTSKILTLSGNITTPARSWRFSGSGTSKIILAGTNSFANTLYLGGNAIVETASDKALNNWNGTLQFGDIATLTPVTATLRLNNSFNMSSVNCRCLVRTTGVDFYLDVVGNNSIVLKNLNYEMGNWGNGNYRATLNKTGDGTLILVGTAGSIAIKDTTPPIATITGLV